jgi:hypothetical protein
VLLRVITKSLALKLWDASQELPSQDYNFHNLTAVCVPIGRSYDAQYQYLTDLDFLEQSQSRQNQVNVQVNQN